MRIETSFGMGFGAADEPQWSKSIHVRAPKGALAKLSKEILDFSGKRGRLLHRGEIVSGGQRRISRRAHHSLRERPLDMLDVVALMLPASGRAIAFGRSQ
jgi:hypothetical protein